MPMEWPPAPRTADCNAPPYANFLADVEPAEFGEGVEGLGRLVAQAPA